MTANPMEAMSISLLAVATTCTIASLIFVLYFRRRSIVAMAQPMMLSILCFGSLLTCIGVAFEVVIAHPKESNPSVPLYNAFCSVLEYVYQIGLYIMFTVLLCKLYRVYKVMQFKRGQTIRFYHVLWPLLIVILIYLGAMIAFSIVLPPDYSVFEIPGIEEPVGGCYVDSMRADIPRVFDIKGIVDGVFRSVLMGATWFFAWKLRDVNEELGESRRIFHVGWISTVVNVSISVINILAQRTDVLGVDEKQVYLLYVILGRLAWFAWIMLCLGFLILPRMYYVWYENTHGRLPDHVSMFGRGKVRVNIETDTTVPTGATTMTTTRTTTTDPKKSTAVTETTVSPLEDRGKEGCPDEEISEAASA